VRAFAWAYELGDPDALAHAVMPGGERFAFEIRDVPLTLGEMVCNTMLVVEFSVDAPSGYENVCAKCARMTGAKPVTTGVSTKGRSHDHRRLTEARTRRRDA
jgi:hypothetical protein